MTFAVSIWLVSYRVKIFQPLKIKRLQLCFSALTGKTIDTNNSSKDNKREKNHKQQIKK